MIRQLRSEVAKVTTTKTILGMLAALAGLVVLGIVVHTYALPAGSLATTSGQRELLIDVGINLGGLFAALIGALSITTEFRTGTIRPTLLAAPHRGGVIVAKALVSAATGAVAAIVSVVVASVAARASLSIRDLASTRPPATTSNCSLAARSQADSSESSDWPSGQSSEPKCPRSSCCSPGCCSSRTYSPSSRPPTVSFQVRSRRRSPDRTARECCKPCGWPRCCCASTPPELSLCLSARPVAGMSPDPPSFRVWRWRSDYAVAQWTHEHGGRLATGWLREYSALVARRTPRSPEPMRTCRA